MPSVKQRTNIEIKLRPGRLEVVCIIDQKKEAKMVFRIISHTVLDRGGAGNKLR